MSGQNKNTCGSGNATDPNFWRDPKVFILFIFMALHSGPTVNNNNNLDKMLEVCCCIARRD